MNVASNSAPRPTSRFLDLLRARSAPGGQGRVGFRAHAEPTKRRIGLVAEFRKVDSQAMRAAVEAGADALEAPASDRQAVKLLADVQRELGVPVGMVTPSGVDADLAHAAAEAGIDWIRIDLGASIAAVGWERPARFLTIPADIDLRLTAALNGPFADAVVVVAGDTGEVSHLALGEALRLRAIGEIVKKPLILHAGVGLPPLPATVSEALGVDALLVPGTGAEAIQRIKEYATQLEHTSDKA
jgi:hypothetical protein